MSWDLGSKGLGLGARVLEGSLNLPWSQGSWDQGFSC